MKFSWYTRWICPDIAVSRRTPRRYPFWLRFSCFLLVVDRWGDRQLRANRLDPVLGTMFVDKRHHYFGRRSSSAWAKKAAALRRISFARFSSRFSRSNSLSRPFSELDNPLRFPSSPSGLSHPFSQALWCTPNLARNRTHRRPLGPVLCLLLHHQPDRSFSNLRRIPRCSVHHSILSRIRVSGKPGAVQTYI